MCIRDSSGIGQFRLFLSGLDYSKIKDETLVSRKYISSDWKMLYTTNLVVYVFHNYRRVLAGKRVKKSPRGQHANAIAREFLHREAMVGITTVKFALNINLCIAIVASFRIDYFFCFYSALQVGVIARPTTK